MIKIKKLPKPTELTDEVISRLTEEFKLTGKPVWKQTYIERALLESSHSKCAYCECKLNIESKYMEVEHFQDKSSNPDLVVVWDNLLPSCKRCNGKKSNHDTLVHPIVNPALMDPREHLALNSYRFIGLTSVGEETIELLQLNDSRKVVFPRFEVSQAVHKEIESLVKKCRTYNDEKTTRRRNQIVQSASNIMEEGTAPEAYAGTVATEIINNQLFVEVIDILKSEGLWNEELETLWYTIQSFALPTKKPLTA
ncbi:hypothetical protein Back11_12220 [Paenibacillus baekrokdamisoli]|uniref:Uncharacterized protein n=1 Tax=Paenibacillus baekrokdamisoli TaxID=1712516 RepID=A0A3G9ILQ0_9BACL|nr:HNH endonuclease [Paenibacillus baekrokdamisoli]MBB3070527.1 hypothetical protein [Paenibacillus baekrokdamisoli]BBH19877.1 hypothetical protein Back11_12220 [Paenibacillus baekrokdamisoli]